MSHVEAEGAGLRPEVLLAAVDLMGREGRRGAVRVQGQSMRPTLAPQQLLAVEFGPERLRRGDMLIFQQGTALLVHRLLWRRGSARGPHLLRTRGDGTTTFDPPLAPGAVVGRVVALQDGAGWRSTRCRRARAYASCVAWHDLLWGAAGVLLRRVEQRLRGPARGPSPLRRALVATDRALLRGVHRLLFRPAHPLVSQSDCMPRVASE
jgi:hypothetical protein